MKYYISKTNDAYFNLAMEEYLMKNVKEEIFYIYQNSPSVIIGKNQNPYMEVGIEYLKNNDIKLVRRLSGGGAVYHDLGNINYAFILPGHAKNLYQFKEYSMPIVNVLNDIYNLEVYFSGRNDLLVDEKKISGSAQFVVDDSLLHHGTLLFDVDFTNVSKILIPNENKLKSKGVKSVSSRVTNIRPFLDESVNVPNLIKTLTDQIADDGEYEFSKEQLLEVEKIAKANKESVQFILQNNKQYQNQCVEYIPGFGTIEIYSNLENGKISELEIFGEYFFKNDFDKFKEDIKGTTFDEPSIMRFLKSIDNFEDYFHRLTREQLAKFILAED